MRHTSSRAGADVSTRPRQWFLTLPGTMQNAVPTGEGAFRVAYPNRRIPDILEAGVGPEIASPRLIAALQEIGATGWEARGVHLFRRDEGLPGYARLVVLGSSPRISYAFHDEHVREVRNVPGVWSPEHACTDPAIDGWDGSDIYRPANSGHTVVSDRVAKALLDAKLGVDLHQVGRGPLESLLLDIEDPNAAADWRTRMGVQPGELEGTPYCPLLLSDNEQCPAAT